MLNTRFRYADLQPVGMGAFGLVWYLSQPGPITWFISNNISMQFSEGPTYWTGSSRKKDHEAFQYTGFG